MPKKLTFEQIKNKLPNYIKLDESTYINTKIKARFIDSEYGEFWNRPGDVLYHSSAHPKRNRAKKISNNLKKYGTEWPLQNKEIRFRIEQTNLKKYGAKCPAQNIDIVRKTKETNLKKYGVESAACTEKVKLKQKNTFLTRYGVTCAMHISDSVDKIKQTLLFKYGVDWNSKDLTTALKMAKSSNKSIIKYHWKTNEELVCIGSYEVKAIDYLNKYQIDYQWQPKVFTLPNGKTYRPDLHIPSRYLWIEIKGYFRDDAEDKWNWFHENYNSELWDTKRLKELGIL